MTKLKGVGFEYVDIVSSGCEGWITLFHNNSLVAVVKAPLIAMEIKADIDAKAEVDHELAIAQNKVVDLEKEVSFLCGDSAVTNTEAWNEAFKEG